MNIPTWRTAVIFLVVLYIIDKYVIKFYNSKLHIGSQCYEWFFTCGTVRKDSIDTRPQLKKNCFWLQYYYGAFDLEKIESESTLTEKKNLTTVLLWYIGLRKNSIGTRSPPKKKFVSGYSIIMMHGT